MIKSWVAYILLIPILILSATDCIHTYIALQAGVQEGNPLMAWVIYNAGFATMVLIKLMWVALLTLLIYVAAKYLK